eukprot:scaffold24405_cov94-Skeletonema_dohrnii-CCMP3373.AAC.1
MKRDCGMDKIVAQFRENKSSAILSKAVPLYSTMSYESTSSIPRPTQGVVSSHSDLYWALRGGGSGYGVITSLETA